MSIFGGCHSRCRFLLQISHNSIHRLGIVDNGPGGSALVAINWLYPGRSRAYEQDQNACIQ